MVLPAAVLQVRILHGQSVVVSRRDRPGIDLELHCPRVGDGRLEADDQPAEVRAVGGLAVERVRFVLRLKIARERHARLVWRCRLSGEAVGQERDEEGDEAEETKHAAAV